jgi:hypothetical protein
MLVSGCAIIDRDSEWALFARFLALDDLMARRRMLCESLKMLYLSLSFSVLGGGWLKLLY